MYYLNSCQSHFSGVYLVFVVFQDTWHSNKENTNAYRNATLSCLLIASTSANLCLVLISFRTRFHALDFHPIFLGACISLCSVEFQTKWRISVFALFAKSAVVHMFSMFQAIDGNQLWPPLGLLCGVDFSLWNFSCLRCFGVANPRQLGKKKNNSSGCWPFLGLCRNARSPISRSTSHRTTPATLSWDSANLPQCQAPAAPPL